MPTGPGSDKTQMVSQEAAYWYIRYMDEPDMRHADKKLFLAWLRRSPENVAEILRVADMDGRFARQRLQEIVDGLEESNVYDISGRGHASQYDYNPSESVPDTVKTKLPHAAWAFAAMIAVLAVLLGFGFAFLRDPTNRTVTTAASEWQHMTLDDGSTVHVDARTHMKVEFTAQRRIVHLYEGQAVFEVAKDANRPFTVSTHIVDVTAVGTRFGVAISPGVTTTVSEGVVRVTPHGKLDDERAVQLHAGQELRVFNGNSGREERLFGGGGGFVDLTEVEVVKVDAERKLDWANGWLTFQGGETFRDIVAQFNRRNTLQIRIDDESIADKRLKAGYYRFRVDSPESFMKVLDSQEGIAVIKDRRNVLRLTTE